LIRIDTIVWGRKRRISWIRPSAGSPTPAHPLQHLHDIKEKSGRFVVIVVKRKPGDRISALLKSLCTSRRQASLAETSGSRDHGQPLDLDLNDEAEQTRSIHQPWRESRRQYLRREDPRGGRR
jgi:hypothetical protein